MNCPQADPLIQTALDGRLSPAERARLDAHLAHCDACRTAWGEYRRLGKTATDWARRSSPGTAGGDFTAQVMAQIVEARTWGHPLCWGLGCLLLVALSFWSGPHLATHIPSAPMLTRESLVAALSLHSIGEPLAETWRTAGRTWQTLTTHPLALPDWVPGALAVTLGLNAAFVRRVRRAGQETAAR